MKKLIILLIAFFAINTYCFASSEKSPHYLQFVSTAYTSYIDKQIFIQTIDDDYIYQGKCLAISDNVITIKYITQGGIKILSIPMHRIKKFYRMEEFK